MSVRPNGPSIAEPASLCLAWERRCHRCWQQIDLLGRSSDGKEATDVQQFPSMTWREHEDQRRRHPSSPMSWDRTTARPASAPHSIDPSSVARFQNEFRSPWPDRSPQIRSPDRYHRPLNSSLPQSAKRVRSVKGKHRSPFWAKLASMQ